MAKRTVGDWDGEGKREAGAAALDEALSKSMAALAKELAARLMESGSSAPRVDGLVREAVLEAARRGLEEAAATVRTAARRTRRGAAAAGCAARVGSGRRRRRRRAGFGWRWGATFACPAGRARVRGRRAWTSRGR